VREYVKKDASFLMKSNQAKVSPTIGKSIRQGCFMLLALFLLLSMNPAAISEESRDLVIVVDVSTSMSELIEEAKEEAIQLVSAANPGDKITIITFGGHAHLLDRQRVRKRSDILSLVQKIDELQATELNTNLPVAMERGLQELLQSYDENPDRKRVLVWLSDDRNNPPPELAGAVTFNKLKQKRIDSLPDHDWFDFTPAIEPQVVSDLDWFVKWARREPIELHAYPMCSELGLIPEGKKSFSVAFEPGSKAAWGSLLSVVAEISDATGKLFSTSIPIEPQVVVCDGTTWKQDFSVTFPERSGDYLCKIRFLSRTEKFLHVSPAEITLKARVQLKEFTIPETLALKDNSSVFEIPPADQLGKIKREYGKAELPDFVQVGKEEQSSNNQSQAENQKQNSSGLSMMTLIFGTGEKKAVFAPAEDMKLKSLLRLSVIYRLAGAAIFAAMIIFFLSFLLWKIIKLSSTTLTGTLEEIGLTNPDRKRHSLRSIARRNHIDSILIGKSNGADIVLEDPTVGDAHAEIFGVKTKAGPLVFLRPLFQNRISINGVEHERQKELHNGDLVTIGKKLFLYRCDSLCRETLIHFLDGSCLRGILMSWDIDAATFAFLPKGAPSPHACMTIHFSEIRTVSFLSKNAHSLLRRFVKGGNYARGKFLEIIFDDGELLEGYTVGDSNTWKKRFYIVPKETNGIALVLVERSAVQQMFTPPTFGRIGI
jgi:hypothetical protein